MHLTWTRPLSWVSASKRACLLRLYRCQTPPSLRNIFKEYENDLCLPKPLNGDLNAWRKEGVLLLNTALSVRGGKPGSHKNKGWEIFTSNLITYVLSKSDDAGFICFGKPAHKLAKKVTEVLNKKDVTIVHSPHPHR